jgi:hypothetical protein
MESPWQVVEKRREEADMQGATSEWARPSLSLSLPQRGRVLLALSLWERDWVRVAALR